MDHTYLDEITNPELQCWVSDQNYDIRMNRFRPESEQWKNEQEDQERLEYLRQNYPEDYLVALRAYKDEKRIDKMYSGHRLFIRFLAGPTHLIAICLCIILGLILASVSGQNAICNIFPVAAAHVRTAGYTLLIVGAILAGIKVIKGLCRFWDWI